MRWLCALGVHRWREMRWGDDGNQPCRDCPRCGRFEVWKHSRFVVAHRADYDDAHYGGPQG